MGASQKFAICNETYQGWTWAEVCKSAAETGYDGVEIAPFTFGPDVRDVDAATRAEIRRVAADHGLDIVGLHWLLVSPKGLHVHTRDTALRAKTVDYLRALIDFAGDIGAPVMIFGSPFQRKIEDGDREGAWQRTLESYLSLVDRLADRGVTLCQESLPSPECDFIMTAAEAAEMVRDVNHPHFRLMLDVKSMCSEERTPAEIIREFAPLVDHFHANDANRRGPGFGDTDFRPIAAALREVGYTRYVSVEVFDYTPDPVTIARESLRYLKEVFDAESGN